MNNGLMIEGQEALLQKEMINLFKGGKVLHLGNEWNNNYINSCKVHIMQAHMKKGGGVD